jgi:multiple antibiotic resistance protein
MGTDLLNLALATFVTFFVMIDPPGVAPIFGSLTAPGGPKYARRMAIRSVIVAGIIILGFAFGGAWLLGALHISLDAFKTAGGILLFMIALEMVFEKRQERRESRAEAVLEDENPNDLPDVSVFPMGIPMLAGPGSIATAMLYMQKANTLAEQSIVIGAIVANLIVCLIIFLLAGPFIKLIGDSVAGAITRIFGVILAALSVQLIIDGIKGAFGIIGG